MQKESAFGNYRAVVVNNRDKEQFGRVLVNIPDLMPEVDPSKGIWARPANNPIGGRNLEDPNQTNYFAGTSYIPKKGSWVFVFFEGGNINRPYYFGALDLQNTKVLPENQVGTEYENKWTILKSGAGRTIIVSDDPYDERTEITGRKRKLTNAPTGDKESVFEIEDNQTTILLDERVDKQKLLIKTYEGDFIKLDIDDRTIEIQVASDIHIKSGGHLLVTTSGDQHFLAGGAMYLTATKDINILSGGTINSQSSGEYNVKSGSHAIEEIGGTKITKVGDELYVQSTGDMHTQSGGMIARDASPDIQDNSGKSKPAPDTAVDATPASPSNPDGSRDS
ncbi:MAG: hypothetical protein DRI84_04340 [Bacteroidetes bacterium]|nr:MAG: hypothetical protein DRI84_04340 [Bacteroidota bacterium]